MAITNSIALHTQATTISLNITNTFTTLISNVPRGRYLFTLGVNGSFECSFDLLLGNGFAQCIAINNCSMKLEPFYNNISDCGLYINNNYILEFQYANNNLSVQTIQGGTLNNCIFIVSYLGIDTPSIGTSNISADFIQAGTGSLVGFKNNINMVSITGSFQLNSNPVLTSEYTDFIPIPINNINTQTNSSVITSNYFGAIYKIDKPVLYNKILCSVNQGISSTGASPRVSIYQTPNGNSANNINLANLISTATGNLGITVGSVDTNLTLIPTGTNILVPGVAYFLCSNDNGANFTYYSYTNSSFRILNSNIITGASSTFLTLIPSLLPPVTFDPTSQTPTVTNVATVFRLCS